MGNVITGTTMSLNGFMNDRNGDISCLYPDLEDQIHRAARAWGVHEHSKKQLR
jgi:hypothetical protein